MDIELLAPAGSYQTMDAAINAGADAVYMGGMKFGARAYAENGDEETIKAAIRYVHLHNKKLYLTVNTLLKDRELEKELYDYLCPLYEEGLDAVIVQDPGVLSFVKENFPNMHIHASTQMTITGKMSASLLEEMGCSRIVTARELSLKEIEDIRKHTTVEIESFVHGALCYCYSGQCLMSSLFGGRSGNRGRCAQPCRLPYAVYDNGKKVNSDKNQFVLSPKDMCTIEILPQIIRAGVTSLKIEGRMKRPEYTAGVVRIYRKYLDLFIKNPKDYRVDKADLQELFDLYNRDGFHTGYYKDHNGPIMMAAKNEKLTNGQKARNEALFKTIKTEYMDKSKKRLINGSLKLHVGTPAILKIGDVEVSGQIVEEAQKQPLSRDRIMAQMKKTGNTPFTFQNLEIDMDDSLFMSMQSLNELRRTGLESFEEHIHEAYARTAAPQKQDLNSKITDEVSGEAHYEICISVETREQLKVALESELVSRIYTSITVFDQKDIYYSVKKYIESAKEKKKKPFLALPFIVRKDSLKYLDNYYQSFIDMGLEGFLVRSLESLAYLRSIGLTSYVVSDANLYTYNKRAQDYYRELGIMRDTAPYELNGKELRSRRNQNSEVIIYGYQPLMVSAQCVKKNFRNCSKKSEIITLQDRYKKEICVKCICDFCYNIIYNSIPLGIWKEADELKRLGFQSFRMNFTLENSKEMEKILKDFGHLYLHNKKTQFPAEQFTKGHLKRGVE